jgi:glucan 1,3-beta-glucosidase
LPQYEVDFESKSPKHNVARLKSALKSIVNLYVNDPKYGGIVKGIEILNEPACWTISRSYIDEIHRSAYNLIRKTVSSSATVMPTVIIHDCFVQPLTKWTSTYNRNSKTFPDGTYAIDTHRYQAFAPQLYDLKTFEQHIQYACGLQKELSTVQDNDFATIVGEWALGLVTKPIYDTMAESLASQNNNSQNLFYRRFYEAQVTTYEKAGGWIYWNWKTHSAAAWSYQAGLTQGWIPQDPTERVFSQKNGCPTTTQIKSVHFATTSSKSKRSYPRRRRHASLKGLDGK